MNLRKRNKMMDRLLEMEERHLSQASTQSRFLRKFRQNRLTIAGSVLFLIILLMALFAPLLTPYQPTKVDIFNRLQAPSHQHILGTDKTGRDVFARILYGGRISIFIGFSSALGAGLIGIAIGCYTGYRRGWYDIAAMRLSEMLMSFPQIILVLLLVSITSPSLWNLIIIFIVTGWSGFFRQTRAQMLSLREEEYVQALKAFGVSDLVICYKHLLINAIGTIFVNITLSTAMFILQESALSFLGLGVPLNIPTWGNILNSAQDLRTLKENWWIWLPVGLVISSFVVSINLIGDGLRDSVDPTQES